MVNSVGSGSVVQAATEALKQATQQDNSSVQSIDPARAGQEPANAVETVRQAETRQHNAGMTGERPDDMEAPRGSYLDISA